MGKWYYFVFIMIKQTLNTTVELAIVFRDHLRSVLGTRLAYFLSHIPQDADFAAVRMTTSNDGNLIDYYYGSELLVHVDMTDPNHVRIPGWEPITLAEIEGSAPGPPFIPAEFKPTIERFAESVDFLIE